jgi:hypothetical protein
MPLMINETYKNVFFGFSSVFLLFATIKHSEYISNNIQSSEDFYFGFAFSLTITCLFVNICLGIFSLFILGNLNDYIEQMSVNLIGAYQKMRVLAILTVFSLITYSSCNLICFVNSIFITSLEQKMLYVTVIVIVFQVSHLISMYSIHPDLYGLKLNKELKDYDKGELLRSEFI